MNNQKKRLGDILIDCNLISEEQLKEALAFQKGKGFKLGEALIEMCLVTEDDIIWALGNQLNISFIHLNASIVDNEVVQMITPEFARDHKLIPLYKAGNQLSICMIDPLDSRPTEFLEGKFGVQISVSICTVFDFEQTFSAIYGPLDVEDTVSGELEETEQKHDMERAIPKGMEAPEKIINYILGQAIINKVDRVHFEPSEKGVMIRFRSHNILSRKTEVPVKIHHEIISRLKKLSQLPDDEENRGGVQIGHFRVNVSSRLVNIQSIFYPTINGEMVVLKLSDFSNISEHLGEEGKQTIEKIAQFVHSNYGVLYVTGPRESGRTTTNYCLLASYDPEKMKLVTVEDPVEATLPATTQIQVGQSGISTSKDAIDLALLLDPDIIYIDKVTDSSVMEQILFASLGGKTIITSLLAHDAASSLVKLMDMESDAVILANSLCGVLCQRLVRVLCPKCKKESKLTEEFVSKFSKNTTTKGFEAVGCEACEGTGYTRKRLVVEFIPTSPKLTQMIINQQKYQDFYQFARKQGIKTIEEQVLELIASGETSADEFLRQF